MSETKTPYYAFLSYSHADSSWAKWLHRQIESHKIDHDLVDKDTSMGRVPRQIRPVFRDRDEFSAGDKLKDQTLSALEKSRTLIIVCSPAAANSRYVNEEIRLFKFHHPDRPVIPVIVSGTPGHPTNECFPEALRCELAADGTLTSKPSEILAADVRPEADGRSLAVAKVVARILGLGTDDIYRRAERERSHRQRRWIAGLSVVAFSLAGLAVWAEFNRRQAEKNFALAKQGADALVVDIAQGLRDVEGMRASAVRKILSRADEIISSLVKESDGDPDLLRSKSTMLNEFVETYIAVGDTNSAEQAAKDGAEVARKLVKRSVDDIDIGRALGRSLLKVGDAFIETGKFEEAESSYNESLAWRKKLSANHPNHLRARRDITVSLNRLGELEEMRGHFPESLKYFEDSLKIRRKLVARKPEWQRDLIVNYMKVADVRLALQDIDGSRSASENALSIARTLAEAKDNVKHQRDLAIVQQRLGNLEIEAGDALAAERAFKASLATFEHLAKLDPGNTEWRRDIAVSYMKLGHAAEAAKEPVAAAKLYRDCVSRLRTLLQTNDQNVQWRIDLAEGLMHLAGVLDTDERGQPARESLHILDQLDIEKKSGKEQQKWRDRLLKLIG